MRSSVALAFAGVAVLAAGGTVTKPAGSDYAVSKTTVESTVAADYLVQSLSGSGQTYVADRHLVVEVAIFPATGKEVTVSLNSFTLCINGKRVALFAQTPEMVASSLKHPDWEYERQLTMAGSVGDRGVILGRPPVSERFPGDPRPGRERLPNPPRVESVTPLAEPKSAAEIAVETALPEGRTRYSVSGHVYFPYGGKLKAIRSVALLVTTGENEPVVLRLR